MARLSFISPPVASASELPGRGRESLQLLRELYQALHERLLVQLPGVRRQVRMSPAHLPERLGVRSQLLPPRLHPIQRLGLQVSGEPPRGLLLAPALRVGDSRLEVAPDRLRLLVER